MRAAIAQICAVPGDPEANLAAMERTIREAAAAGADLVCFPELFYSGYHLNPSDMERLALRRDSAPIRRMCAMAASSGTHVLVSYPERDAENGVLSDPPRRGFSCVVDQYGRVMAGLEQQEALLLCDIDMTDDRRRTAPHLRELDASTFPQLAAAAEGWFQAR